MGAAGLRARTTGMGEPVYLRRPRGSTPTSKPALRHPRPSLEQMVEMARVHQETTRIALQVAGLARVQRDKDRDKDQDREEKREDEVNPDFDPRF